MQDNKLYKISLLVFFCISSILLKAQSPINLPLPNSPTAYYRIGWIKSDSGTILALRDTALRPLYPGTSIFWQHSGVDSVGWVWDGLRWKKGGGVSAFNLRSGNVTLLNSDVTSALGYTPLSNITNYLQAGTNVAVTGIGTLASPYVISSTGGGGGGSVTSFSFTNGNGITGTVSNATTTPNLSLGTSLTGIISGNGTGFGTVSIGSGLNYTGGVLSATQATSLNGLVSANGSAFTTASIGAGLSFTGNTLVNTINNTNQLTNGALFLTNITGLVTQGTNVTITGSGTSGSPYVINSTGSGSGTVTTFSSGNLTPLFTTSVTNPNTIPALSFSLSNAAANSVFGNNTGSTGAPVYYVPTISTLNGWASGSIALLGVANTFTATQTFNNNIALASNITFGTDNTYAIGTSTVGANAVYSRFLSSDGILSLTTSTSNPIVFAPNSVTKMTLLASGQLQLNGYTTSTSFTGTPNAFLQSDASGDIIQTAVSSIQTSLSNTPSGGFPLFNANSSAIRELFSGTNLTIDSTTHPGGYTINASGGGGGSPAGANYQLQFYNGGSFGASSTLAKDPTTNGLDVFPSYVGYAGIFVDNISTSAAAATQIFLGDGSSVTSRGLQINMLDSSFSGGADLATIRCTANGGMIIAPDSVNLWFESGVPGLSNKFTGTIFYPSGDFDWGTDFGGGLPIDHGTKMFVRGSIKSDSALYAGDIGHGFAPIIAAPYKDQLPVAERVGISIAGLTVNNTQWPIVDFDSLDIRLHDYPNTRNDGAGSNYLYTDANGHLKSSTGSPGWGPAGNAYGTQKYFGTTDNNNIQMITNNHPMGVLWNSGHWEIGSGGTDLGMQLHVTGAVTATSNILTAGYFGITASGEGFSVNSSSVQLSNLIGNTGTILDNNSTVANIGTGNHIAWDYTPNITTASSTDTNYIILANPTLNCTGTFGAKRIVGFAYNPTETSINFVHQVAFYDSVGDEEFNTSSGVAAFGKSALSTARVAIAGANATQSSLNLASSGVYNATLHTGDLNYADHGGTNDSLNFYHNGTTTNLLAGGGGGSQTLQQVFNVGSGGNQTLTKADTVTFSSAVWKNFGLSHDTTNTLGVLGMANDSSVRAFSWAAVAAKVSPLLPTFTINTHNGLYASGGDSVGLGTNPLDQNTTINTAGFNFLIEGSLNVNASSSTAIAGPALTINGNVSATTSTSVRGYWINVPRANTFTEGSSGTLAQGETVFLGDETFAAGSATTYTNAATLFINGPPAAGSNVTITNPWAIFVFAGNCFLGSNVSTFTGGSVSTTHILGNNQTGLGSAPSIAAGTGAGTSPTISITGTDMDGAITLTTGTTPAGTNATIATITFGYSFPTNTYVTLTPANEATAALTTTGQVYIGSSSTTNFILNSGTVGLTGATAYKWYYHTGGY